jgi:iron complex outermembrane recepter protein
VTPALVALLLGTPAAAQSPDTRLPSEALITVTAPAAPGRVATPIVGLSGEALLDRQPRSVADALRGLPGVSVRTNSRGETVARVRGSDERQTLVFLDGAPLAVPWDGRVDIGLLPAGLVGGLVVRKGAGAIEYGANAVAGVVDLTTRS